MPQHKFPIYQQFVLGHIITTTYIYNHTGAEHGFTCCTHINSLKTSQFSGGHNFYPQITEPKGRQTSDENRLNCQCSMLCGHIRAELDSVTTPWVPDTEAVC